MEKIKNQQDQRSEVSGEGRRNKSKKGMGKRSGMGVGSRDRRGTEVKTCMETQHVTPQRWRHNMLHHSDGDATCYTTAMETQHATPQRWRHNMLHHSDGDATCYTTAMETQHVTPQRWRHNMLHHSDGDTTCYTTAMETQHVVLTSFSVVVSTTVMVYGRGPTNKRRFPSSERLSALGPNSSPFTTTLARTLMIGQACCSESYIASDPDEEALNSRRPSGEKTTPVTTPRCCLRTRAGCVN